MAAVGSLPLTCPFRTGFRSAQARETASSKLALISVTTTTSTSMWKTVKVLVAERGPHVDSRSLGLFLKRHDPGDREPEEVTEVTTERHSQRRGVIWCRCGLLREVDVNVLAVRHPPTDRWPQG